MKKVALMVFSNSIGGAESVVKEIIKNLSRETIEVYAIINDEIRSDFEKLLDDNHLYSVGKLFPGKSNSLFIKAIRKLGRMIKVFDNKKTILNSKFNDVETFLEKENIGIVHAHLVLDVYLLAELKKKLRDKLFAVFTMHGSLNLDPSDTQGTVFEKNSFIEQLKSLDYYTSACNYFFSVLEKNGILLSNKKILIENGIDMQAVQSFHTEPQKTEDLHIVYLGGERYLKGPDLLLQALNLLIYKHGLNRIKLNVLRDIRPNSPFRKMADKLKINDFINYIGYVPSPNHLKYINESDIFILPSRTEGIANTLMEAIALEKAIVATNVGGTPELVIENENGLLAYTDPESIAQKLRILIMSKELREKFAQQNKKIKPKYDWVCIVKKYEQLYLGGVTNEV